MSLGHLDNYELLRHENEPGYQEECAKRFEQLIKDEETVVAVSRGGVDVDQPLDELTEEVEKLLEKSEAFEDLVESLLENQIEEHMQFYRSSEYLDQIHFENLWGKINYHPEQFYKYLSWHGFPEELAYEIQEGIAKNDIRGYWEVTSYKQVDYNILTCDPLGYFEEEPDDEVQDALRFFEEKDFPKLLTMDKKLFIDLSDDFPCYCVRPENIEKYLEEHYREEYDRIRAKRA